MKLADLKDNPLNPRKMTSDDLEGLQASMQKFGDLSGFIYNRRTKVLLGGHQKKKLVGAGGKITITNKYEAPTEAKTVAEGFVEVFGERYKYREVDADEQWEREAMIAANKHSGEWDGDLLRLMANDGVLDWKVAGFKDFELKQYNINVPEVKIEPITVANPFETISEQADEEPEQTDEEYLKTHQGPEERFDSPDSKLDLINSRSAFESAVEEGEKVVDKRWVIIIDCKDSDSKEDLKDRLRPLIEQAGAKIF